MPIVGRKKFSYTRKGVAAAKAEAKKTGKGISMKKGYKKGGVAKKKAGGAAKKMQRGGHVPAQERMASGEPIQWQQGPVGERRRMDYRNYVTPGVARRQLARQGAAGGPGRRAANIGGGGWKKGGAVSKVSNRSGFNLYGYKKGGSVKTR